jgi:hypothetical protein
MPVLRQQPHARSERATVPAMRDQAVRGQAAAVSRKRGSRNGVSTRVAQDMAARLHRVRALWFAVQNDPKKSVEDVAAEFYFAVGELLEGRALKQLQLRHIDRDRALAHAEE